MEHGGTQEALSCLALTKAGPRCKNRALTGQSYCGRHAGPPDPVEEHPEPAAPVDPGKPHGEWLVEDSPVPAYGLLEELKAATPSIGNAPRPSAAGGPKSGSGGGWAVVILIAVVVLILGVVGGDDGGGATSGGGGPVATSGPAVDSQASQFAARLQGVVCQLYREGYTDAEVAGLIVSSGVDSSTQQNFARAVAAAKRNC
jgi:hypothetical protein